MQSDLYKCCFCLSTTIDPIVMCRETHVACFKCMCDYIDKTENLSCPMCREQLHLRFDRLITETSKTFRRSKRRKIQNKSYGVFLKLLVLKHKNKYFSFTKCLQRFVRAVNAEGNNIEDIEKDLDNIIKSIKSIRKLKSLKLYDHTLFIRDI
jgi:hypothetical protein